MYRHDLCMTTALITGATAGLGAEFATQLARSGYDLVVVARDEVRLQATAARLRTQFGVDVEVLAADLSSEEETQRVAARAGSRDQPIDLVVNNAGFGLQQAFAESAVADQVRLLDVLVRAVLVITHSAVGAMRERGHGAVLNVSSVAAFGALGSYSAAKAWVTTFSESLAGELAGTGVLVSVVHPGFTRTEFHERAAMNMAMLPAFGWLPADRVVRDALADLRRGRVVSIPSKRYRVMVALMRTIPADLRRRGSAAIANLRR